MSTSTASAVLPATHLSNTSELAPPASPPSPEHSDHSGVRITTENRDTGEVVHTVRFPPHASAAVRTDSGDAGESGGGGGALPPAAQVRLSLLRRVWSAMNSVEGPRRRRFALLTLVGFAEIVALIVVASLAYHQPCDKPLGPYIVMIIVRLAVAFPLSLYSSLNQGPPRNGATSEQRAAWESYRPVGSRRLDQRMRKFSDLISLLSFVLFLFGNYWLISEDTCHATAPVLYKGALAALILSWLWTAEIILYLILVIFFLPFFLLGMRFFGVGEKKNEVGPLGKSDIEKLPQRIFVGVLPSTETGRPAEASMVPPSPSESPQSDTSPSAKPEAKLASTSSSVTPAPSVHRSPSPKKQWWRLWRKSTSAGTSSPGATASTPSAATASGFVKFPAGVEPILLPASQNSCSICLCEYELPPLATDTAAASEWKPEEEILSVLACGHAFHSACLGDWLAVSGRCPLCQRPVLEPKKGKKPRPDRSGSSNGGGEGSAGPGADARV